MRKFLGRAVVNLLCLTVVFASSVSLASTVIRETPKDTELAHVDERSQVPFEPLHDLRLAGPHLWDPAGEQTLLWGAGLLVVSRQFDEEARDAYSKQRKLGGLEDLGNNVLGTGVPGLALGAGLWGLGRQASDAKMVHAGQASIEAIATTAVATFAIKSLSLRDRPDGSDKYSFPSGHTSTVFASAGVLHEFYGWRVGAIADALGLVTAFARVADDRHWLSDTAAGGLLGFAIGRAIARAHLGETLNRERKDTLSILPWLDPNSVGLTLATRF